MMNRLGMNLSLFASASVIVVACRGSEPSGPPTARVATIAFDSNRDGNYEIYVMNADGSGVRQVTTGGGADPAWSPDGTKIAFESDRDGNFEIYVMNSDGSDLRRLTTSPGDDLHPAWRP
jgi:TolB protein